MSTLGLVILCGTLGQTLHEAHNEVRVQRSLPPVVQDKYLDRYAVWWAKEMSERRGLKHSPIRHIMKYGYTTVGENIAVGQRSEAEVMKSWMSSRGHRTNILNGRFNKIGCARYKNYWCVVFARK